MKTGSDERNCPLKPPSSCPPGQLPCRDGQGCYTHEQRCDYFPQCQDNTDEDGCGCKVEELTCGDGNCLPSYLKCDGRQDCPGGEDEQECPCSSSQFSCDDRTCLPLALKCNGARDCSRGEDEIGCPATCTSEQVSCNDGKCLPIALKCDGKQDCRNGADEEGCRTPVRCLETQFACTSRDECVPQSAQCNSHFDCRDGSDEDNCEGGGGLRLKPYPPNQTIKVGNQVVFQCRDEGNLRAAVEWSRENAPLPPGSRVVKDGRLEIPNIQLEHTGLYVCSAKGFSPSTPGSRVTVYLEVEQDSEKFFPVKPVCGRDEATCSNGDCIPKNRVCDGRRDCMDDSDELRCSGSHECEPNQFRCNNKKCVTKSWLCDSEDDCGDGSDEANCAPSPSGSKCRFNEFQCETRNQCIPKAFHCDTEQDCLDNSDETGCSKPHISWPPPSLEQKRPGEQFTINCTVVGVPMPEVVWRLNWGNIPDKCLTTSVNGFGTLTCPNIQESDQGAYSCEGLNNQGSTFATPDTILIVKPYPTVCQQGMFNEEECTPCFCFGVSTTCRSANIFLSVHFPPVIQKVVNVYISPQGAIDVRNNEYSQFQQSFSPTGRRGYQIFLTDNSLGSSSYNPVHPYFGTPENYLGNQLKSYGGYLKFTVKSDGTGISTNIPDIILTGNNITLVYKDAPIRPNVDNRVVVRFYPEKWYKIQPSGAEYPASRQDLMLVLQQVDQLLIRSQYFSDGLATTVSDISMDTAVEYDVGQGPASLVEQCSCPVGYSGLSCESCQEGYKHRPGGGWLGTCEEARVECPSLYYRDWDDRCQPCPCPHSDSPQFGGQGCYLDNSRNIICQCQTGYEGRSCEKCSEYYDGNPLLHQPCVRRREPECDPAGSLYSYRDPYTGRCQCKEFTTGPSCNQCKPNSFNFASGNQYGCIQCFCMGHNGTCTSSDLYRTQISAAFPRDNQGFKLAEMNQLDNLITDIPVNPNAQEIYFQQFNPEVYYWVLPSKFLNNRVTSYGGYLRYTFRYIPTPGGQSSPNTAPDVEIVSENNVHLVHYHNKSMPLPEANRQVTVTVPLLEQYWEHVGGRVANREHLMMSLAELEYILIKATYTTSTQEAALISVSLDTATAERNTGQRRAVEVEVCQCPVGYRGTSCEECDTGFSRINEGIYLGTCGPCNCNGYSTQCDPDTGNCLNCGGYTTGQRCDKCKEGFVGDPLSGVPCSPITEGCHCDPRGSLNTNCDSEQRCTCKINVIGKSCDQCRQGTYDLSEANVEGCIDCYCSGTTNECRSSNLYREAIPMQILGDNHGFTLSDRRLDNVINKGFLLNPSMNEIGYNFSNERLQDMFWSLPEQFTGNKVLSYGGNLNFTRSYTLLPNFQQDSYTEVLLVGPSLRLFWVDDEALPPNTHKAFSIPLRENSWRRQGPLISHRVASRTELMKVLSKLAAVQIRAQDSIYTQTSYLSDVSLDSAVSQRYGAHQLASEVEVCSCPLGYLGTSCESCAPGYYQIDTGSCEKCPCNGNEEYCTENGDGEVICTCKPPYGGANCDTINRPENPPSHTAPESPNISISILEPTVIVIEAGKDVTFTCNGRSLESKPVELTWSKENGYLPTGRAFDNHQGVLIIRNVQSYDAGTYICTASDGFSHVTEKAILNIGGAQERPRVIVNPTTLEVREGEPVEFHCTATGSPAPTLSWGKEPFDKLPPASSFASGKFRIPYASLQDEGTYRCVARNSAGEDYVNVYLYVSSTPVQPPPQPVELLIQPHQYRGITGELVRLECRATGPSNIRLQWSRLDGALSPSAIEAQGILQIYKSQPEDTGIYTCTAVDQSTGSVLKEIRIQVYVAPPHRPPTTLRVDPPRQKVPQGTVAELRCFSSEGSVQWTKAGDPRLPSTAVVDGPILRITNVQVHDRGVYVCEAGHSKETSILEVEPREMPEVELYPSSSQTVVVGRSTMFQCRIVKGIPSPTVRWTRVDGLPIASHVVQMPNGVLRIDSAQRTDEGDYLCTAENPLGIARTEANIRVISLPAITIYPYGRTLNVAQRQNVRLECRATGHPTPTVTWSKHVPGSSPYNRNVPTTEIEQGVVYEIKAVSQDDEGTYVCEAHNEAGESKESIQLTLNEDFGPQRGDIPSPGSGVYIPDDDFVVPLGGKVTIACKVQGLQPQQVRLDWRRGDRRPLSAYSYVRDGILYISYVEYSDNGEYVCHGLDSRGVDLWTASANVRVIRPSSIKLEPERQVVKAGSNARITCTATGEGRIEISWLSDNGQPLPPNIRDYGGVIEFIRIQESDAGKYICRAKGAHGTLEASAHVLVKGSTHLMPPSDRNQRATEGSSVFLKCNSSEETSWRRDGLPLPAGARQEGSALRLENLQLEDAGRYICRINSYNFPVEDYIYLHVDRLETNIQLKIEASKSEVYYGDTVDLRCLALGPAGVKVFWTMADGTDIPNNARVSREILRITSVTSENSRTYRCTAFYNNNRVNSDYYLTVHDDRPSQDARATENVTADYGKTVKLVCEVNLEGSITYAWTKHGGELPANAQASGPDLTISDVTYKDAGLYMCNADNGTVRADIPKIILVRGAVPFFPQSPLSYLALPTLSNSYLNFNIEITFKPESPNGLIIYNGQLLGGGGDFISFGLQDAVPEFRFDVGSGLGVVRGSQKLTLGEWHTVQLVREKKEGSMYVDDDQYYSNSSRGRMQGLDLNQPLFLGGVPHFTEIARQNGFDSGFVGCISHLAINRMDIDIMKEQKGAEGMTLCETCAENPCVNSGVCQETPTKAGYTCLCPRGFSGLNCAHTGEPCYPGACGSGRCLDSDDGLECYCELGKTGDRCDRDVSIIEPSFSKNSYLAYPTPKRLPKIKINLRFNPVSYSNGLLLYCAENYEGSGDFVSLSIRDRHVEFKFNGGTGLATLQSSSEMKPGEWMSVNAIVAGRQATLSVTGEPFPVSQEVQSDVFKFTTPLYVGGFDKERIKLATGVGVRHGFEGCVSEVYVSSLNLDIIQSVVDSANINQCSARRSDPCELRPCQNGGVCYPSPDGQHQCSCPFGFSGQNCEVQLNICTEQQPCQSGGSCVVTSSTSFKCVCPTGFAGSTCSDKFDWTDINFNGDGFVEFRKDLLPHSDVDEEEVIHIEFTTRQPNGLLLWQGQAPETHGLGQDYLSLAVVDGYLELSYELGGSSPAKIVSKVRVDDGHKHDVVARRKAKAGSLVVDKTDTVEGESGGLQIQLNTEGNIYIGGLPDIDYMTGIQGNTGFSGCIHDLMIQNSGLIEFSETAISSTQISSCPDSDSLTTGNAEREEDDEGVN